MSEMILFFIYRSTGHFGFCPSGTLTTVNERRQRLIGKRQEATLETRQKLIGAVKKLSETKAYHEMSIDDITQTAYVANGTFYTYFKHREDIISIIAYENLNQVLKHASDETIDVIERIAQFLIDTDAIIQENSLQIAQQWYRSVTSLLDNVIKLN